MPTVNPKAGAFVLAIALAAGSCQLAEKPDGFRLDVINATEVAIVVSVVSDTAGVMQGLLPGDRGSITIDVGTPTNGVGLEVFRADDCSYLVDGTQQFPTPDPLTVTISGGPAPGTGTIEVNSGVGQQPLALPRNALRCPGG